MQKKRILATLIASSLWVSAYAAGPEAGGAPQAVPVDVIEVTSKAQTLTMELPGRSRAFMEAEVRPQVNGIIEARAFVEGSEVTAGQSLYQIDARVYQAALVTAEAELARAEAALTSTTSTYTRYQSLLKSKSVSQQEFDQAQAAYLEAKASVAIAKAAINTAKINLAYTKVEAPISGRIGKSNVTEGALIGAGQAQALATISQLDPINVDIVQSSSQMLNLKQRMAKGSLIQPEQATVSLILEDGSLYAHQGQLKFAEVTVNEDTGTVSMRAQFPNPEELLLPGMFVRAIVTIGTDPQAILVPQKAVTRNPKGQGVAMVVSADNKVEPRIVTTAEAINNQWRIVDGLKVGDKVIVAGLQKVRPGAVVSANVVPANADAAASSDNK